MSRLEFNFKEIEKEPFMFKVTDRTGQIVAEVRLLGWILKILESIRDSKPPFLGADDHSLP
jgi:hypothetical protein